MTKAQFIGSYILKIVLVPYHMYSICKCNHFMGLWLSTLPDSIHTYSFKFFLWYTSISHAVHPHKHTKIFSFYIFFF